MTKRNYMKRLYLLAKWCLPEEEAKEVIQDYQEIVTNIEPEENLVSRLGTPYQAIRPLMPQYMVVCIFVLCGLFGGGFYRFIFGLSHFFWYAYFLFFVVYCFVKWLYVLFLWHIQNKTI